MSSSRLRIRWFFGGFIGDFGLLDQGFGLALFWGALSRSQWFLGSWRLFS